MKLLITGGCGFLGSNLAHYALNHGYEVVVFDNLHRTGALDNLNWLLTQKKQLIFVHGDIRNTSDVESVISKFLPQAVFHLAGQVAMTTSIANPRLDFETNVLGSFNLLEAVRKYIPQATVIYSSTNKVYGDLEQFRYYETDLRYVCSDKPNGFAETIGLDFHSPYGVSKGSADQYMLDYHRIFGLKTVVFRHSSMYGGRQFSTYDQGWVGWFCSQAVKTRQDATTKFTISGNGKQVRDVLHADDMINLYFSTLNKIDIAQGKAFNIGGGFANSLSLLELFVYLEQTLDVKLNYTHLQVRQSDQKVFIADITLAQQLLNFVPQVSYQEGIKRMLEWVESTMSIESSINYDK